jgi:lysophospholipase L1-like esterase
MRKIIYILIALVGLMSRLSAQPREELTVLALGDSITEGGQHFVCYRAYLPELLASDTVNYTFVGPKRDVSSAHAGYSGKNSAYIASIIDGVYRRYPADIVLLHMGHNHFSKNQPVPGILAATEQIVSTVLKRNPEAMILIAQVIPAGKLPKYDYIPDLNQALVEFVADSPHAAHLVLVDQAQGFDWHTDTVSDKVHPNQSGALKMAKKWNLAIRALHAQ